MEIISAGEKIKRLRLELGINQAALTNDQITRGLISMIENNKRSLTYNTAIIVAEMFNNYYKHVGQKITPEYLMETDIQQAERQINEEIEKMKQLLENPMPGNAASVRAGIERLIDFSKEMNLEFMIGELLKIRGKFYYDLYQYNVALQDFFLALEYYMREGSYDGLVSMYTVIGSSHYHLELYHQALLHYNQAENLIINHAELIHNVELRRGYVIYNRMLCYKKTKEYNSVFKELNCFRELNISEEILKMQVLIVEGNTFRDIANYDKALKIYDSIANRPNCSPNISLLVYENYAELYYQAGDYQRSFGYINKALSYAKEANLNYSVRLFSQSKKIIHALGNQWNLNVSLTTNLEA